MTGLRMGGTLRRAIGAVVTLALLAAAIGFYALSPRVSLISGPGPVATAEPAPPQNTSQSASPSPSRSPSSTPSPTRTAQRSPNRDLPPGPGGRQPGIRLVATPTADGAFDVIETVHLAEPVSRLTLVPPDLTGASPDLRGKQPVAEDLQVRADGRRIDVSRTTVRRERVLSITRPTDLFELRYRLREVTAINKPSSAGRALGAVGPLTGVPDELPVAVTVRGHSVRNLSCPCLPVADQACAAGNRPNVHVNQNLRRRDALVEVQLDLTAIQAGGPR